MPRQFQPDPSTFLCFQLGRLGTKESKMAAKMVNRKMCSVWAETWHFSCQRPCQHAQIVSARSEHFFEWKNLNKGKRQRDKAAMPQLINATASDQPASSSHKWVCFSCFHRLADWLVRLWDDPTLRKFAWSQLICVAPGCFKSKAPRHRMLIASCKRGHLSPLFFYCFN